MESKKDSYIIIQEPDDDNTLNDSKYIKKKLKDIYMNLLMEIVEIYTLSVNIKCMWCCHNFKNIPVAVPHQYINKNFTSKETFVVSIISYIFNSNIVPSENGKDIHFKFIEKKLTDNNEKITLAPPRETLKEFGGFYTIDEFRNLNKDRTFTMINPPMISIVPKIEENTYNYKLRNDDSFIPLNKELLKKAGDSLKIRRQRKNKNTLKKYMNLQIA